MIKMNKCNNCGGEDFEPFLQLPIAGTTDEYQASAFRANGEKLVKCNSCGLVFIHPFAHDDVVIIDGYSNAIDNEYVSQIEHRIKTFRKCMDTVEKVTGLYGGRILDLGAAAGAFVKVAKDRGWDASGVEPCGFLVRWAMEKLSLENMYTGTLGTADISGSFDIITMWDVLEHVPDPDNTVFMAKKLLTDGGYIVTNLPDISALLPRIMGPRWPFYASCHLYYYTPETIDFLMNKHGFERVYKAPHWQELSLGYLAYRFEQFSKTVSTIMVTITNMLGISEWPIKYNIGQTLFIYKKK